MKLSDKLEPYRERTGPLGSPAGDAAGLFSLPGPCGERLVIYATPGDADDPPLARGWEHVSVSTRRRLPNWTEMCFAKDLCWDAEDTVIQYHPPKSRYVNEVPYCLHLWKPPGRLRLPPMMLVGRSGEARLASIGRPGFAKYAGAYVPTPPSK